MQMTMWKIIYLNCGERYEDMIDHRSYAHNLNSCEIKAWKKFRPEPRGGTPYNGLYGEAPPERGTFFRLQVYKRVGISQVEVYKRVAKSVI